MATRKLNLSDVLKAWGEVFGAIFQACETTLGFVFRAEVVVPDDK